MGDYGSFWLPEQASTFASQVDSLFQFVTWTSLVIFVGVIAAMLYFVVRYRRRSADERPEMVEESKIVEISWVVIPTILVLIVFTWGFKSYVNMYTAPPNAYNIKVTAWSWKWRFEYPNGTQVMDTLIVPANRPVKLTMSSQDVIHSFFVPAFRVKHDVLPNRYTSLWFEATKQTGESGFYNLFCTEYCGTGHSAMIGGVKVLSQENFQKWLESGGGNYDEMPLPEYGEVLYTQQGCQTCHSVDGAPKVGPTWKGLYGKDNHEMADGTTLEADANYLRESILNPGAKIVAGYNNIMPASYGGLSERQLTALIEYMKTLSDKEVSTTTASLAR
ncbi:cytochrome c oxidase subunit II [Salisaeta longa]|uniref:cytochrome c oxidase subunit II n=1 Tax=Salisaeta longa TaxID=503170 RepID=UPI0003B35A53|nr:cytochrome c oxidase subunit II [Salisaeta longa]